MNNYGDCLEKAGELETQVKRLEAEMFDLNELLRATKQTASDQAGEIQGLRHQLEEEHQALAWFDDKGLTLAISPQCNMNERGRYSAALAQKPSIMWKAYVIKENSFWARTWEHRIVAECYGWSFLDLLQDGRKRVEEQEVVTRS